MKNLEKKPTNGGKPEIENKTITKLAANTEFCWLIAIQLAKYFGKNLKQLTK